MLTQTERTRRYRQKKRAQGLCWFCTKPATPGGTLCGIHTAKRAKRAATSAEAGRCMQCHTRPAMYGSVCIPCLEKRLEIRAVKASESLPRELRYAPRCRKCHVIGHATRYCGVISEETVCLLEWLALRENLPRERQKGPSGPPPQKP
jgi:hypothetical protein